MEHSVDSDTLALAAEYAEDLDGTTWHEIFEGDVDVDLWETHPQLAARLAFTRVQEHWKAQALAGVTQGVPVLRDQQTDDSDDAATAVAA